MTIQEEWAKFNGSWIDFQKAYNQRPEVKAYKKAYHLKHRADNTRISLEEKKKQ